MIYIYEKGGAVQVQRGIRPAGDRVIELRNMIPEPVKPGYRAVLRADFATRRVWFDLVETTEGARARVIAAIDAHDKGPAVNSFSVGGIPMWLDRETRAGLERAINADKALGRETTVIWHEGPPPVRFELPIAAAEGMLLRLEAYAKETFNRTQQHKAAVYALGSRAEIEAYNYTAGYPEKLIFDL